MLQTNLTNGDHLVPLRTEQNHGKLDHQRGTAGEGFSGLAVRGWMGEHPGKGDEGS